MSLDDQIRQVADRILNGVRGQLEAELRRLVQDAVADVRQKAHAQLAQIRDAAQRHADELKRHSDAQLAELRTTLDATRSRAQADVEDARRIAQTQVDDVQRVMEQRVGDLQAQLSEGLRRLAEADARVADAERQLVETRREADESRRQAEDARASGSRDRDHIGRLAGAVRALGGAEALGDVFERLAESASGEAQRVAVLVARGDRLHGWTLRGFGDQAPAPRTISIDPAEAAAPPFAADGTSRDAVALPLVVGGAAVAVLYADAPATDAAGRARWTAALDVLVRHASRVLEALTLQQAIGLTRPNAVARASHEQEASSRSDRS